MLADDVTIAFGTIDEAQQYFVAGRDACLIGWLM